MVQLPADIADSFTTTEGQHSFPDGLKAYTKTWTPKSPTIARIAFIHGFSDHCNAYGILFPTLASRGIATHALDQRGWGRTVRRRSDWGLTGPTTQVMSDITSFLETLLPGPASKPDQPPLFLAGHSMGGAQILYYASHPSTPQHILAHLHGYLAESPFIRFSAPAAPSNLTVKVGRLAGKVLPRRQMTNKMDPSCLSRDPEVSRAYAEDRLCHETGTLEGLAGMLDRREALDVGATVLGEGKGPDGKTRVWVSHGTGDQVCEFEGTKVWFEREKIADKTFRVYDGWAHKLHAEPGEDKETFAREFGDWILARLPSADNGEVGKPSASATVAPVPAPAPALNSTSIEGEAGKEELERSKL